MKQSVTLASIAVLGLTFFGCKHSAGISDCYDCDTLTYAGTKNLSSIADITVDRHIIIPEVKDNSLIGRTLKRIIEHDSLLIFVDDMKQVLAFTKDGKHKFTIHNVGQGPGEYTYLTDAAVYANKNELLLLTYDMLLSYSLSDGSFIEVKANFESYPDEVVVNGDRAYLLEATYLNNKVCDNSVAVVDLTTGDMIEYMKPNEQFAPSISYNGPALNSFGGNQVVMTRKFDPYIYLLEPDSYTPIYSINWGNKALRPEADEVYTSEELTELSMKAGKIFVINDLQRGDSIMTFSTNVPKVYYANLATKEVFGTIMMMDSELPLSTIHLYPVTDSDGWIIAVYNNMVVQMTAKHHLDNAALQSLAAQLDDDANQLMIMYKLK